MSDGKAGSPSERFGIGSSIPVLRMLDESAARAFYLDFLGFAIDWEHRFTPSRAESPLYLQLHLGDAVVHLDGHADQNTPVAEIRIPVRDLQGYAEHLRSKRPDGHEITPVDPRYEGKPTDLNLVDPAGNMITFWLQEDA